MQQHQYIRGRFKIFSRQGKGEVFKQALQDHGYQRVSTSKEAQFILADHDQRGDLSSIYHHSKSFFIYPHSARSMLLWDGIIPPTSATSCNFVFAPGHKEIMKRYGYKRPVEVVGWTYCPILPFQPSDKIERVLFAPMHPNASVDTKGRRLMEADQRLNRTVFQILHKMGFKDLVVRYGGDLKDNGLEICQGVRYDLADLTIQSSLEAIKGYDLIVGTQTFAYLAIASGVPTVMFGEEVVPHSMAVTVRSWDKYKDLLMFPYDLLKGNARTVLEQAIAGDTAIREWKDRMIGAAFSSSSFVKALERYF